MNKLIVCYISFLLIGHIFISTEPRIPAVTPWSTDRSPSASINRHEAGTDEKNCRLVPTYTVRNVRGNVVVVLSKPKVICDEELRRLEDGSSEEMPPNEDPSVRIERLRDTRRLVPSRFG